jgi:hypothetical protein
MLVHIKLTIQEQNIINSKEMQIQVSIREEGQRQIRE